MKDWSTRDFSHSASGVAEGIEHFEGFGVRGTVLFSVIRIAEAQIVQQRRRAGCLAAMAGNGFQFSLDGHADIHPGIRLLNYDSPFTRLTPVASKI